jgi:DNA-binding MarR family transcriptional regulator
MTRSEPSADLETAAALRLAVTRMARRLRQEALAGERDGLNLSPTNVAALATLERHGPLTPSELAEREGIKRPTATRALGLLEQAGLIDRTPDPEDRRSALVSVNATGAEQLRRLRRRKNAYIAKRMRSLDPGEAEVLRRAAAILERMLAPEHR